MAGLDGEGGRWDEFDIAAEAFQEMVEEQKESLKGVLEEEVMELNQVRMDGNEVGRSSGEAPRLGCLFLSPLRVMEEALFNIFRMPRIAILLDTDKVSVGEVDLMMPIFRMRPIL